MSEKRNPVLYVLEPVGVALLMVASFVLVISLTGLVMLSVSIAVNVLLVYVIWRLSRR